MALLLWTSDPHIRRTQAPQREFYGNRRGLFVDFFSNHYSSRYPKPSPASLPERKPLAITVLPKKLIGNINRLILYSSEITSTSNSVDDESSKASWSSPLDWLSPPKVTMVSLWFPSRIRPDALPERESSGR